MYLSSDLDQVGIEELVAGGRGETLRSVHMEPSWALDSQTDAFLGEPLGGSPLKLPA